MKIGQQTIFALLLIGCTHNVAPVEVLAIDPINTQTPNPYFWHDGSTGGEYGIGDGWSIELLPADYGTELQGFTVGPPAAGNPFIPIPAEYEWVKDDTEDLSGDPIMVEKLITVPAEYMTVTETIVVRPAATEYYLSEADYNADGGLNTPITVKRRNMPTQTKQVERQVVKRPERTEWRTVPLERRKGYRRVLKTAAGYTEDTSAYHGPYYLPKVIETNPWRFLIKKPNAGIVHVFDKYEDLTAFIDSFK